MPQPRIPQYVSVALLAASLLLPIIVCVVLGVASLLTAMGDTLGGGVLRYAALGCSILWTIDLICLLLVLAINAVKDRDETDDSNEP